MVMVTEPSSLVADAGQCSRGGSAAGVRLRAGGWHDVLPDRPRSLQSHWARSRYLSPTELFLLPMPATPSAARGLRFARGWACSSSQEPGDRGPGHLSTGEGLSAVSYRWGDAAAGLARWDRWHR